MTDYLLQAVLTHGERAMIVLSMARSASAARQRTHYVG